MEVRQWPEMVQCFERVSKASHDGGTVNAMIYERIGRYRTRGSSERTRGCEYCSTVPR